MQNRKRFFVGLAALTCMMIGCAKTAGDAGADSPASASATASTDRSADTRTIVALDSGWMRNVMAKNVDSLMTYYAPEAVSYGFGAPAIGTDQIRSLYTEMVKSTVADPMINSNTVRYSEDGTMAFDHGTYSMTITPPGGKASTEGGAFLNVWKKTDGQWKLVAEMSTPVAVPKK